MYNSIVEAQEARAELVEKIQSIDVQLARRGAEVAIGKVDDDTYKAYLTWKARACGAKAVLNSKLHKTKRWIQATREAQSAARTAKRGGGEVLLNELYGLTKSLVAAGAEINPDEQLLLDDVGAFLANH